MSVAGAQSEDGFWSLWVGFGQFFNDDAVPERRIAGLPVGGVLSMDRIGKGTGLFEATKGDEQLAHFSEAFGRDKSAGGNERISAPIEEPRITRDNGD